MLLVLNTCARTFRVGWTGSLSLNEEAVGLALSPAMPMPSSSTFNCSPVLPDVGVGVGSGDALGACVGTAVGSGVGVAVGRICLSAKFSLVIAIPLFIVTEYPLPPTGTVCIQPVGTVCERVYVPLQTF